MLIVQFPSALHEIAIESLVGPFSRALVNLVEETRACNGSIVRGKTNYYGYEPKAGSFIADASFDVDGESIFHIEVAFSQFGRRVRQS
jgi:hypothetical protein